MTKFRYSTDFCEDFHEDYVGCFWLGFETLDNIKFFLGSHPEVESVKISYVNGNTITITTEEVQDEVGT